MSEQTGPSFGVVLATVWKVLCALLLIPFLILLVYIAVQVIPGSYLIWPLGVLVIGGLLMVTREIWKEVTSDSS